ncbi:unnamed protein product [Phytophthora fragariaefolia]|uniref:Unnamed protein product n=1 Tax=Phytophthora fragariaefolia TaxID=1490495 RepID=A0A9W6UDU9_9STRA|nr:unnamed protein product [Phytophthora fragariaefolia]
MRPALPTNFALCRDLFRAQSFGEMLDVLRANTAEPPSSTKELTELRIQNAKLTRHNQALLRRLESALASSTRFEHDLATVVRERDEWKCHATKTSELVASFRNTVCVLELQPRESTRQANRRVDSCQQLVDHLRRMVDQRNKDLKRMSEVLAERDITYAGLQGMASSYFEQVQEAAAVISSGGADRALRFANQTIDYQRRVIQRQKNVLRHNGHISVTDPALALTAAAGIDAPGLSPGVLALNARGPVAPSSAPVSLPLSSAAPTSSSSAAGLVMTPADFHVPSAEPRRAPGSPFRRVPGSPFRRYHLVPVTRPSVHVSASTLVPPSGSAASTAPITSSASSVSSVVVTSAPESTVRPLPTDSAGSASSTLPSTRRASPRSTKASAGSASKSACKPPSKSAARSSRRARRSSAASSSSTSTVAPAPSTTGSARSQRALALNARAINSLELQTLKASDAALQRWSSGAASSGILATSATSPLVVDSPSPPATALPPAPVVTPSSQRQSSSDDSADDEAVPQRSRRLRKKSVVESDGSSDSVADELERKLASPLPLAPVSPAPSTGQMRPSSPVTPVPTTKVRAISPAKSLSPPSPVIKSASKARRAAKSSKATKLASKSTRTTTKPDKAAKSAVPTLPASGQSVSTSGSAAVSAPTSAASSRQVLNSAGGATSLPDVLRLPILTLRTRGAQPGSRDSRVPAQMKIWCDPPFFHFGPARCWDQILGSCVVEIQKETVDDKPRVPSTRSSLSGLAAFADVYAAQHPSQRLWALFPDGPRGGVLDQVPWRPPRNGQGVRRPLRTHALARGFKGRSRSSPRPEPDELSSSAELVGFRYQLWSKYNHEFEQRSDARRSDITELYETLYKAVTEFDAASNTPAPQLDLELYFDPSVPFAPPPTCRGFRPVQTGARRRSTLMSVRLGVLGGFACPSSIRVTCDSVRVIPGFLSSGPLGPTSANSRP